MIGLELGLAYQKTGAQNPIYPVGNIGLYRVTSQDTTGIRFGASVGAALGFEPSGWGPSLEVRYFRMFGDPRFKSLLPISLRWGF